MTGRSLRRTAPGACFRAGVVASTLTLPRGAIRDRYRHELLAELHACSPHDRAGYTVGVLTHAWALRLAVGDDEPVAKEATMQHKPLTCRLNMHHTWHTYSTDDGGRYRRCTRCGKDDDRGGRTGDGAWAPFLPSG